VAVIYIHGFLPLLTSASSCHTLMPLILPMPTSSPSFPAWGGGQWRGVLGSTRLTHAACRLHMPAAPAAIPCAHYTSPACTLAPHLLPLPPCLTYLCPTLLHTGPQSLC